MPTAVYAGKSVAVNEEGFFENPDRVDRGHGARHSPGLQGSTSSPSSTGGFSKFMRSEYAEKGTGPTVRVLGKTSGVTVKELYELFPKGPAKTAARIAGIPKPRGCI